MKHSMFVAAIALLVALPQIALGQWKYQTETDELRGGPASTVAHIQSPDGNGILMIRNGPRGLDYLVGVTRVGTLDGRYTVQYSLRFDDDPITSGSGGMGSSNTAVFLKPPEDFVKRTLSAQRMIVELPMWRRRPVQLTFNVAGLDAQKLGLPYGAPTSYIERPVTDNAGKEAAAQSRTVGEAAKSNSGSFSLQAERVAVSEKCHTAPIARLTASGAGFENYTIPCSNGDALAVRCDFGTCRALK